MNVVLWIVQAVLAAVFLAAGVLKISRPKDELAKNMGWVTHFSATNVKLIGTAELLGGLGLVLPAATKIAPVLTPIAAAALGVTMIGALITHSRLRDPVANFAPSIVLLLLSAFVAWGRFGPYHF